jgi:F subunit of K+-transporting ATPase (Potass_KdpF)
MSFTELVMLAVSVALFLYLTYVVLRGERL